MGQQQAKSKAIKAFRLALEQAQPPLSQEQKDTLARCFEQNLL